MITEDYVSFETAKLLKEKGFDWDCQYCYIDEDDSDKEQLEVPTGYEAEIDAPTLQMAMKWLRDIHGLFIHIDVIREASCWLADIQDIKEDVNIYPVEEDFPNYEQACEAGIKYCLTNLV